jgi:hypothetical protein
MTTALNILCGELNLSALEHRFVLALLDGSPIARQGAAFLIPIGNLCKIVEAQRDSQNIPGVDRDRVLRDQVAEYLARLLRSPKSLIPANGRANLTLFVLSRVELGITTFYAECQFDSRFLALLRSVAASHHVDPY